MKYLTKEWFETLQSRGAQYGKRVHAGAKIFDEKLYERLYKRQERKFVKEQREVYDIDPRFLLETMSSAMIPLDKALSGEEISEEDFEFYEMPEKEKARILQAIEDYDNRLPFDAEETKKLFAQTQQTQIKAYESSLPEEILDKIADLRVFTLGYCSAEVMKSLKKFEGDAEKRLRRIESAALKALKAENLPEETVDKISFHDCVVTETVRENQDLILKFDTKGGFSSFDKMILRNAEIVLSEETLVGGRWLCEELYGAENGYELHVMFEGKNFFEIMEKGGDLKEGLFYFTVVCSDIIVENDD